MSLTVSTHNLSWFSFLSRIVRLCVFKFAVLPVSTIYQRFILDRWNNHFSGSGFFGCSGNFDASRAQRMVNALLELGGEEIRIAPRDNEANLQVIKLTAAVLKSKVENLGGVWEKNGTEILIRSPGSKTSEWNSFYQNTLKKIFPKESIVDGNSVLVTAPHAELIPFDGQEKTRCVLFSRLGRSFVMNKYEIAYFLGRGIDVVVYDTRGVLNSEGYPSEAGLYNDIDAVGEEVMRTYSPNEVCIYGSCGDSFSAMHLFKRYHAEGINLILDNAPASLDRVLSRVNCIAAYIFSFVSDYIKAPKVSAYAGVKEDGFNSLEKMLDLPVPTEDIQYGYVVLSETIGDSTAPPAEVKEMAALLREKGNNVSVLTNRAEDSQMKEGQADPHLANPLRNPKLQDGYLRALFV